MARGPACLGEGREIKAAALSLALNAQEKIHPVAQRPKNAVPASETPREPKGGEKKFSPSGVQPRPFTCQNPLVSLDLISQNGTALISFLRLYLTSTNRCQILTFLLLPL